MVLDEFTVSKAIIERYFEKLKECLKADVVVVGGGPSGMVASYYLSKRGFKVVLLEKNLSLGGGIWGGGMMFNEIVVQEGGKEILEEMGIRVKPFGDGYFTADAIEVASGLCFATVRAGTKVLNLITVEDLMVKEGRVTGVVVNWSSVILASLHVDPLTIEAKSVVDATGHKAEVVRLLEGRMPLGLEFLKEAPLWAEKGEKLVLENTREVFPGLYVAGMAANAISGGPRMGPIFGGMLLSGKKVAELIAKRLEE